MHLSHLLEALLHFLNLTLLTAWIQDILHRVFLVLLNTVASNPEALILDDVGHDFLLDGPCVLLRIDTEDNLFLQLHQLFTAMRVLKQMVNQRIQLWIDGCSHADVQTKHPTN